MNKLIIASIGEENIELITILAERFLTGVDKCVSTQSIGDVINELKTSVSDGDSVAVVADDYMGRVGNKCQFLHDYLKQDPCGTEKFGDYQKVINQIGVQIPVIFMADYSATIQAVSPANNSTTAVFTVGDLETQERIPLEEAIHAAIPKPRIEVYQQRDYVGAIKRMAELRPEFIKF